MVKITVRYPDYITCPYPNTYFIKCRYIIVLPGDGSIVIRCPYCGRGI